MKSLDAVSSKINRVGYYSSLFLSTITFVTFGFAMTAIPNSGAFCPGDCFKYPYLDTLAEFPRDYLWIFVAPILVITYMIFVSVLHGSASEKNKIYSRIALIFAIVSAVVLLLAYFTQISVIPASLLNEETKGITLWTQYNPHGLFIALEELGYIMMSFSFLFLSFIYTNKSSLHKAIRWIYLLAFIFTVFSFVLISVKYGIDRKDRFEVLVISVDWLVLIINGILTSKLYRRAIKQN